MSAATPCAAPSDDWAVAVSEAFRPNCDAAEAMWAAYTLETTEPMIATPRAPPTCRVVSLIAEPTPAFSRGSDPITDSVAGAIVMPMPAAITMKNEMTIGYGESAAIVDSNT